MTAFAIVVLLTLFAGIFWLVERNHRRLGDRDRSPFGVGLEEDRDAVRTWADVSALQARRIPLSSTGLSSTGHGSRYAA